MLNLSVQAILIFGVKDSSTGLNDRSFGKKFKIFELIFNETVYWYSRWFNIPRENRIVNSVLIMILGINFVIFSNELMYVYQIQELCIKQYILVKSKCHEI